MNKSKSNNSKIELFNYNIKPKMLSRLKTYDDWHNGIKGSSKIH